MSRKRWALFVVQAAFLALPAGCAAPAKLSRAEIPVRLEESASLELAGPAVAICPDRGRLVLLESSGARLVVLDSALTPVDTIPLTTRLAAPRGVAADRFYFYAYDDEVLYRALKNDLVLKPWVSRVYVAGLAGYAAGEMLVSDDERSAVWYKTIFGESRRFLDATAASDPGPIVSLPEGMFCVLDQGRRLVFFNRAGIVTRAVRLAGFHNLMASDETGALYLTGSGSNRITRVSDKGQLVCELVRVKGVEGIATLPGRLVVLDSGARVAVYPLSSF